MSSDLTSGGTDRPVLSVSGLNVAAGHTSLLHDIDLAIFRGERVGLIGESGSGKSLTALSIIGLLSDGLSATGDVALLGHEGNLLHRSESHMARVRGDDMTMVFQEPMTALNPTARVGAQVAEVIRLHRDVSRSVAKARAVEVLGQVGLEDPVGIARSYPHQLSGGQRQRVVVAIALANDPVLLLCDEPTTALDVTVQALVLDLIVAGVEARDAALLFITHDLAVVSAVCERVLVMYGGRIVESGPVAEVFADPRHRYTQGLLAASDIGSVPAGSALPTIEGTVPAAGQFGSGCVFRGRCAEATPTCESQPPWSVRGSHPAGDAAYGFACFHPAGDDND